MVKIKVFLKSLKESLLLLIGSVAGAIIGSAYATNPNGFDWNATVIGTFVIVFILVLIVNWASSN